MKNLSKVAGIYTRISNDREGAGLGVQRQEEDCRALADALGWKVEQVYQDNDISAYQRKKPRIGYNAMLRDLKEAKITAVIAWHSDRLHRRTAELETFIDIIEATGAEVETVKGGTLDLSSPDGRMMAKFHGAIAQREVEHGRERITRAKQQAAESGKWRGGRRPFGYEPDGITAREDEASALRAAASAFIAGQSLRSIAREMAGNGITTTGKGLPMDEIALRSILLRARNAGLVEHNGEVVATAQWQPILSEDTWRAVVSKLSDPARTTNNTGSARRWIGSGLFVCGICGNKVRASMTSRGYRVYRCKSGSHISRAVEAVDNYVVDVIAGVLSQPATLQTLTAQTAIDVAPLTAEVAALRSRRDHLGMDYAAGNLNGAQVRLATNALEAKIAAVEAQLAAAGLGAGVSNLATSADPVQTFFDANLGRKRAIIDKLATVVILPQGRGRPKDWKPGMAYFDPSTVNIRPRSA